MGAVAVLAILLAVLLNLIVRAVPAKYTEFDLSEAGLYSLSDSSKEIARSLTQDVNIYYLAETGSEDAILTKLLDRYASESSHIRWERKDPAVYPTFAAQYGVQSAENGSLILVSGEKSVVLEASDLYDYDYSDYYTAGTYSVTYTVTDGNNLNMRGGPGTDYDKIGQVPASTGVTALGTNEDGSWVVVNYNGTYGWLKTEFLNG